MNFDKNFSQGILDGISDFQGFRENAERKLGLGASADPQCWIDWIDSQGMLVSASLENNNEKCFVLSQLHDILGAWSDYDKRLTSGVYFKRLGIGIPNDSVYEDSISNERKEELGRKIAVNIVRAVFDNAHVDSDGFGHGYYVNSLVNLKDIINGDVA